jgi:hypothetical protein
MDLEIALKTENTSGVTPDNCMTKDGFIIVVLIK